MKNKGFTLIELLAVIVILAIIALIAVPIIINIINDARESGYKRSIDNYGKAVEQAIGTYQISNPNNQIAGTYTSATLEATEGLSINYEGSRVVCSNIVVNENGTIYMSGCTVGGHSVVGYTYGIAPSEEPEEPEEPEEQVSIPHYYWYVWESRSIGDGVPDDASESAPEDRNVYIRFDSSNGTTIDASYVCFLQGDPVVEYCIQGGVAEELKADLFTTNQGILDSIYPNNCSLEHESYLDRDKYLCNGEEGSITFTVAAYSSSQAQAQAASGSCVIYANDTYECYDD